MRTSALITALRPIAGLLMLMNVVGMLFFSLPATALIYGSLGIVALGMFCFLPRKRLGGAWIAAAALAVVAMAATLVVAYGDISLVNGADHPALAIRGVESCILLAMLVEAWGARPGSRAQR